MSRLLGLFLLAIIAAPSAALAAEKIYSYDPADARTRALVEQGVTLIFDRNLISFRIKEIRATQAAAGAVVAYADERELGAPLASLLPAGARERELYVITNEKEGAGMVRAFCPGSTKGWLVFSAPRQSRDLAVQVLGDNPAGGGARFCTTLKLTYRGEWALPLRDPLAPVPRASTGIPF